MLAISPPLQSTTAAPSPVMGGMATSDAMASGPMAPGFFQVQPGLGPPVSQPWVGLCQACACWPYSQLGRGLMAWDPFRRARGLFLHLEPQSMVL